MCLQRTVDGLKATKPTKKCPLSREMIGLHIHEPVLQRVRASRSNVKVFMIILDICLQCGRNEQNFEGEVCSTRVSSFATSKASLELHRIQGKRGIWFCGAYHGTHFSSSWPTKLKQQRILEDKKGSFVEDCFSAVFVGRNFFVIVLLLMLIMSTKVIRVLAEASKKIFSSMNSKVGNFIIDQKDIDTGEFVKETNIINVNMPDWALALEAARMLPTNVGQELGDALMKLWTRIHPNGKKEC
ncbi:hypothetical protein Tco_1505720 [Tanacetum coccineum]